MVPASCSWFLALSTWWGMPRRLSRSLSISEASMDVVPTRTGRLVSWSVAMFSVTTRHLASSDWNTRSDASSRAMGRFVGITVTSRP